MTIAVNDLVILQGASEAPISAAISAKRATQENRQSATARKGWVVWCPSAPVDRFKQQQGNNMKPFQQATPQVIIVAGAGNSAGQAAMFVYEGAEKVLLIVRGDSLTKSMSSYLSRRVETKENIEILYQTEIRRMTGRRKLESVELEHTGTSARRTVETPAVFSMICALPCTGWLPDEIERDDKGFILTGAKVAQSSAWQKMNRAPGPMETSLPGVFAAGDVRSGSVKRCAAAVGEGGMAVANVHRALAEYRTR